MRPTLEELATEYVIIRSQAQSETKASDMSLLLGEMYARVGVKETEAQLNKAEQILKMLGG